jgi:hypothetical protein
MHKIAESNVLLRTQSSLPEGFKALTEEFREGWLVMRTMGATQLGKKIRAKNWILVRSESNAKGSGVAKNEPDAIARALKQALRSVDVNSNAVEVNRVEVTAYPWFFLARLSVNPLRMQEDVSTLGEDGSTARIDGRSKSARRKSLIPAPFEGGIPALKALLTANKGSSVSTQELLVHG